jgi:hypothetical protein
MDFRAFAVRELTAVADKLADAANTQTDEATAQLTATLETTIDRLRTDQSQLVIENERLTAENSALSWEKDQLIEAARTSSRSALLDCLSDVFDRIALSSTVDDVLLATAHALAGDFKRVAVFKGDNRVVQLGSEAPLGPASAPAITAPLNVRGDTVAVIYADDEARSDGTGARLVDLLQRHAMLALERLTIELKTIGELRAYAQMLLDEVEYVFDADTTAGMNVGDRRERLKENLRCARQIYGQRVTLEGPAAGSVLDDVFARILDAKAETPFGQELLEVATAVESVHASA